MVRSEVSFLALLYVTTEEIYSLSLDQLLTNVDRHIQYVDKRAERKFPGLYFKLRGYEIIPVVKVEVYECFINCWVNKKFSIAVFLF